MVQLLSQLAFVDQFCQRHIGRPVDQAEADRGFGIVVQDALRHQQLVEVRVDHGPHDRVDLESVIIDACCDVSHERPVDRQGPPIMHSFAIGSIARMENRVFGVAANAIWQ